MKHQDADLGNTARMSNDYHLDFVSEYIDSISETLRSISLKIHDNPELGFKEYIAHKTLTEFLKTREGWKVTPSAYGIETAFIAEYGSGVAGPVISFNAEYGKGYAFSYRLRWLIMDLRCVTRYRTLMWP